MKKALFILSIVALFASRFSLTLGQIGEMQASKDVDVYVVGYELNVQNILTPILWKNGISKNLTDGIKVDSQDGYSVSTSGNNVFVFENDVYVTGYENNAAKLWKNGKEEKLNYGNENTYASSVFVSDGDVYVTGSKTWKNGDVLYEPSYGFGVSVFVSGKDIYVAGVEDHDAILWKNGKAQILQGREGGGDAIANSVFVSDGNVYVVGWNGFFHDNGTGYLIAVLWKNGEEIKITDETKEAEANAVFVANGDVYIVGREDSDAVIWKNGIVQKLTESGSGNAYSVYVSGEDVYVAGIENGVAKLWKNGVDQKLIKNNSKSSCANSVFVR